MATTTPAIRLYALGSSRCIDARSHLWYLKYVTDESFITGLSSAGLGIGGNLARHSRISAWMWYVHRIAAPYSQVYDTHTQTIRNQTAFKARTRTVLG